MSTRTIATSTGQITVDPATDELVLDGRKDRPSVQYLRHDRHGVSVLYVYRPRQRAHGEEMHELVEVISAQELQNEIDHIATSEPLTEYADLARLRALGFRVPGPTPEQR